MSVDVLWIKNWRKLRPDRSLFKLFPALPTRDLSLGVRWNDQETLQTHLETRALESQLDT